MKPHFQNWWEAVAIAGLLLVGCSTVPRQHGSVGTAADENAAAARLSEEQLEQRVASAAHFATAISLDLQEKSDQALEYYWKAAQANPAYEPLALEVGRRMIRAKDFDRAIDVLSKASQSKTASAALHAWLGVAYAQAGQTNAAIKANQIAIRKSPDSLSPYQNLAQLYIETGRPEEALRVLRQASAQKGADAEFLAGLAESYTRLKTLKLLPEQIASERALALLERAAAAEPSKSPKTLLRLADGFATLGDLKQAEKFYLELLTEYPDLLLVHEKLADIYLRTERDDEAAEHLRAITRGNPTNPQPYIFLASLALDDKNYDEAAEFLERALLLNPEIEQAYYELAGLKLTLGKPNEALDWLKRARKKFSRSFVLEFYSAVTHSALKNFSEAIAHFVSAELLAKTTDPSKLNHVFYYQFGSAYEQRGEYEQAEEQLLKAIELQPDFAEALNYLGYMWADRGVNLERSKELIEKALQQEPNNAAYLDSLGWVLFKMKQHEPALEFLRKAIEHSEEPDPVLYDHLGDVQAALRRWDEARAAWEKALSLSSEDLKVELQRKLSTLPSSTAASP